MEEKYEGKISGREFIPGEDGGGMGINGTWINKRTGTKVNVRNSIMDGDNMIIITDRGQISMTEFSRDYIQASDEIYDSSGKVVGHEEVTPEDYGQNEEWVQIQEVMAGNKNAQFTNVSLPQVNTNENIIKKVFDKLDSFPEIDTHIKWDDFPGAQINTLVNFLDVSIDDIAKYIINNYANTESLAESVKKILEEKLNK